jgi:hypothetical protein
VEVSDDLVRIVVAGQGDLRPQQELEDALRGQLFGKSVSLEVVPETRTTFETTAAGED